MKQWSTFFLRAAILGIGAVVLAIATLALPLMWREVPREYPDHTYVFYLIISALYVAAVPFYFALYQAWQLLTLIDRKRVFSKMSVRVLQRIAISAVVISLVFASVSPLFYIWAQNDDAPGLIIVNMFLVVAPFTIAVFAAVLRQVFSEANRIKSENDLTV